jgi:hypothetical protein
LTDEDNKQPEGEFTITGKSLLAAGVAVLKLPIVNQVLYVNN